MRRALPRVIQKVGHRRVRVTADRGCANVALFTLLTALGVACVLRVKKSTKSCIAGVWHKLDTLRFAAIRAIGRGDACSTVRGRPNRCGSP
jgi:hypothetical protein